MLRASERWGSGHGALDSVRCIRAIVAPWQKLCWTLHEVLVTTITLVQICKHDSNISATQMVHNEASVMSLRLLGIHMHIRNGTCGVRHINLLHPKFYVGFVAALRRLAHLAPTCTSHRQQRMPIPSPRSPLHPARKWNLSPSHPKLITNHVIQTPWVQLCEFLGVKNFPDPPPNTATASDSEPFKYTIDFVVKQVNNTIVIFLLSYQSWWGQ